MTITLTPKKVCHNLAKNLDNVQAIKNSKQYGTCQYVYPGGCVCIVGAGFSKRDITTIRKLHKDWEAAEAERGFATGFAGPLGQQIDSLVGNGTVAIKGTSKVEEFLRDLGRLQTKHDHMMGDRKDLAKAKALRRAAWSFIHKWSPK